MKSGKYLGGWRFDWEEARRDVEQLRAAGRDFAAACCADPGCVSCPSCGKHHWREFERFECARCGAEVTMDLHAWTNVTAGPPKHPELCRSRYRSGMRVRWSPRQGTRRGKLNEGSWRAGKVPVGTLGTIQRDPDAPFSNPDAGWLVVWDGIEPRRGFVFVLIGPWTDDDLEVVTP